MRQRAKALKMLKQVRAIGIGPQTENAVGEVTRKNTRAKLSGTNYFIAEPEIARKRLVKSFIPSRASMGVVAARRTARRVFNPVTARRARELFGEKGKYGIMVVRPELFASTQKVKQFLKALEIKPVLNRTVVFDKTTFLEMYPQTFNYAVEKENFPVFAANVQSGPNKIIVFRFPTNRVIAYKEAFLANLKRIIREKVTSPVLEKHGLFGGKLTEFGKDLDSTGHVRTQKPDMKRTLIQYSGVHIPDAKMMERDALMLLSRREIKMLEKLK